MQSCSTQSGTTLCLPRVVYVLSVGEEEDQSSAGRAPGRERTVAGQVPTWKVLMTVPGVFVDRRCLPHW